MVVALWLSFEVSWPSAWLFWCNFDSSYDSPPIQIPYSRHERNWGHNHDKNLTNTSLQTFQNFLIQKMLQKTLKICVIIPAFFDPEMEEKYEICSKNFSSKKSWEKHKFSHDFLIVEVLQAYSVAIHHIKKMLRKLVLSLRFFWPEKF